MQPIEAKLAEITTAGCTYTLIRLPTSAVTAYSYTSTLAIAVLTNAGAPRI